MQKVTQFIEYWDNLGAEYSLSYKRAPRHQSLCGAALTVIAYLVVAFASFTTIMTYLDRSNVDVSTSIQYTATYPHINPPKIDFYPIILAFDKHGRQLSSAESFAYFTLRGVLVKSELSSLTDTKGKIKRDLWGYQPCTALPQPLDFYKKFYSYGGEEMKALVEYGGLCPDLADHSKLMVFGALGTPLFNFYQVIVAPCVLPVQALCQSEANVQGVQIKMLIPQHSFEAEDYQNPVKIAANIDEGFKIDPSTSTEYRYQFRTVEIEDDVSENSLAAPTEKAKFIDLDLEKASYSTLPRTVSGGLKVHCDKDNASCAPYVNLIFRSGNKLVKISRIYAKLFDILGEVGGLLGIVIGAFGIAYLAYAWKEQDTLKEELFHGGGLKEFKGKARQNQVGPIASRREAAKGFGQEDDKVKEDLVEDAQDWFLPLRGMNTAEVLCSAFLSEESKILLPIAINNYFINKMGKNTETRKEPEKPAYCQQQLGNVKQVGGGNHPGSGQEEQNPEKPLKQTIKDLVEELALNLDKSNKLDFPARNNSRQNNFLVRKPDNSKQYKAHPKTEIESDQRLQIEYVSDKDYTVNSSPFQPTKTLISKDKNKILKK